MSKPKPGSDRDQRARAILECKAVDAHMKAGHPPYGVASTTKVQGAVTLAADELGENRVSFVYRVGKPDKPGLWQRKFGIAPRWALYKGKPVEAVLGEIRQTVRQKKAAEKLEREQRREEKKQERFSLGGSPHDRKIVALEDKVRRLEQALKESHRDALTQDAIRDMLGVVGATPADPPSWTIELKPRKGVATPEVPMTIWSDWHGGEVVKPEQVNGINAFNIEIFKSRVRQLVANTINLCHNHHSGNYPGIVINLLGDFISGELHLELAKSDEVPTIPQVLLARDLLVWALREMIAAFGQVYCPCSSGNHGRDTDRPETKDYVQKNFDWLVYQLLIREFAGDTRIRFDVPDSNDVFYKVYNLRFLATHGDMLGVKGGDGIIGAIGPIMRGEVKTSRQSAAVGREYDIALMGHWHQELWLPRAIVANSLKGFDQFAHKFLRAVPSAPTQPLWFVHPTRRITARWSVSVDDENSAPVRDTEWVSVFAA